MNKYTIRPNKHEIIKLSINKWKNTVSVIKWFKNINDKRLYKFLQFSIFKDFHPSIKEIFLHEAIKLLKNICLLQKI